MVSYFKTQWHKIFIGIGCLIYSLVIVFTGENITMTDSLENMYIGVTTVIRCISWLITGIFWLLSSYIEHNSDCIKELNKRVKNLEQQKENK